MVGPDMRVLDVGCAAGDTAQALVDQGCTVSGIDIEDAVPAERRSIFERLLVGDIEREPLSTLFDAGSFDVVVFGDVLEHLLDPVAALRDASVLLSDGGRVVVSIPNVTHASVRYALAQGRWRYTETGLLDETHVRFYTRESVCDVLERGGLVIDDLRATIADPFDVEVEFQAEALPDGFVEWVRHQPDAMAYQFLATAHVALDDEQPARPPLRPGAPPDRVRRRDSFHAAAEESRRERHQELRLRDHVVGLEAQAARAAASEAAAIAKQDRLELRAKKLRAQLDDVLREIDALPRWKTTPALREAVEAARSPRLRKEP
nr:class I SAM-dependent methyltransferase [Nocardioides flavescens]